MCASAARVQLAPELDPRVALDVVIIEYFRLKLCKKTVSPGETPSAPGCINGLSSLDLMLCFVRLLLLQGLKVKARSFIVVCKASPNNC